MSTPSANGQIDIPHCIEAEQGVLGAILLDNDVLHEIIPLLKVEDFFRDDHQVIYRAIRYLYEQGKGIDAITLAEELTLRGEFKKIGGDETLAEILGCVPHSANAKFHAEIVRGKAITRELYEGYNCGLCEARSNRFTEAQLVGKLVAWTERMVLRFNEAREETEVVDRWPKMIPEAFHGVAGNIVARLEPHSEGDPAATLVQILVAFGNLAGRGPYWVAGSTRHHLNLYCAVIGETGEGRKGTGWDDVKYVMRMIDPTWVAQCIKPGLGSGEGLIYHVRDASTRIDKKGKEQIDPGVSDKRLLAIEPEFGRLLSIASRPGNTITPILRAAWDDGYLANLIKNSPDRATDAHISLIAHATPADIQAHLTTTDILNGFANRILWTASRRSKLLPHGGQIATVNWNPVLARLRDSLDCARACGEMTFSGAAQELWSHQYERLMSGRIGLWGAATSRAAPQVKRIACLFALLDAKMEVGEGQLLAAIAVWDYCEATARMVFGEGVGNKDLDKLLSAIIENPGISRKQITVNIFGGNKDRASIDGLLGQLLTSGKAHLKKEPTKGKPIERWFPGRPQD